MLPDSRTVSWFGTLLSEFPFRTAVWRSRMININDGGYGYGHVGGNGPFLPPDFVSRHHGPQSNSLPTDYLHECLYSMNAGLLGIGKPYDGLLEVAESVDAC
jgi:hypothetical protein